MAANWLLVAATAALAAISIVWAVLATRTPAAANTDQVRRIRINGRYQPSEVHIAAGEPARLIFHREETAPCSERVVFPDFGISVTLPPLEDVAVDLPASDPGRHDFTCELQMLHGTLVIDRVTEAS
jgi:plastocyanin domain-containing protein